MNPKKGEVELCTINPHRHVPMRRIFPYHTNQLHLETEKNQRRAFSVDMAATFLRDNGSMMKLSQTEAGNSELPQNILLDDIDSTLANVSDKYYILLEIHCIKLFVVI